MPGGWFARHSFLCNHPVMNIAITLTCVAFAGLSLVLWRRQRKARREAHIRNFKLPPGLFDKLMHHYPALSVKDCQLVAQGLRQFFLAHLKSGKKFVAMPSQVVDELWHEFILYTREYEQFCRQAFGGFLHHTPAVMLSRSRQGDAGIRRTWHFACHEENINPYKPTRLPLLFALDSKFSIPDGFVYVPDCSGFKRQNDDGGGGGAVYCGADFAGGGDSGSGSGSSDGCGDGGGDSSGDGGSDGGGGCGGGGCGGGGGD
jgi:hypothetical protein